jgi:hypothetical protein
MIIFFFFSNLKGQKFFLCGPNPGRGLPIANTVLEHLSELQDFYSKL